MASPIESLKKAMPKVRSSEAVFGIRYSLVRYLLNDAGLSSELADELSASLTTETRSSESIVTISTHLSKRIIEDIDGTVWLEENNLI